MSRINPLDAAAVKGSEATVKNTVPPLLADHIFIHKDSGPGISFCSL